MRHQTEVARKAHNERPGQSHHLRRVVRRQAENRPGVYRFVGPNGEVLYIGKSVAIRSRLLSYFRADLSSKQAELLRVAVGVEWEYTPNEFEALLREFRHIRTFRPRFNKQHRRDRRFAWIRLTRESAPRLVATRRPHPSRCRHFGPFPAPRRLPRLLRELSAAVGLRDCAPGTPIHFADQAELFPPSRDPLCPRAELGSCPAPCAGRCSSSDYGANVREIERFLEGETDAPLDRTLSRMEGAAARQEFEIAARLRDRAEELRALRDQVVLFHHLLKSLSFVYRVPSVPDGPDWGYLLSSGRILCSFPFPLDPRSTPLPDPIRRALRAGSSSMKLLAATPVEEILLVTRWFRWRPKERLRTVPYHELASEWKRRRGNGNDVAGTG